MITFSDYILSTKKPRFPQNPQHLQKVHDEIVPTKPRELQFREVWLELAAEWRKLADEQEAQAKPR